MPFIIIFIMIPLAEVMVFMAVSDKIGLGMALLMALFTAILGGFVVKYQGIQTMFNAQKSLQHGELPSKELFDGLCLVAAGATLITPGFITDAIGFSLLIPSFRDTLRQRLSKSQRFQTSEFHARHDGFNTRHNPRDPNVIDVEYETIEDDDKS